LTSPPKSPSPYLRRGGQRGRGRKLFTISIYPIR
jgi:hypothetical protein